MKFISYTARSFKKTEYYTKLPEAERETFDVLANVFHFKVNEYVLSHLIDWENIPDDPIYRLIFPRKEMLAQPDFDLLKGLIKAGVGQEGLMPYIQQAKQHVSPHIPHHESSLPQVNHQPIAGMYSNFDTIVSLFPSPMVRTCHSYCSYCFRWAMFNNAELQQQTSYNDPETPVPFLTENPKIKDVLFTGADPLVLKSSTLKQYIEPILAVDSIEVIRISSKSLAWWPYRFTTDSDAEELLELFEYVQARGKHMTIIAHFTHPKELESDAVQEAIKRIRATGTVIRCQGPLVQGINDQPEIWASLWKKQIALGMVPYYMFVEADHNAENCFRIPLAECLRIFQEAQKVTTGLARTVRGPVFMNDLNRVLLDGTTTLNGQKYFVLKSLQCPPNLKSEGKIKLIPYSEKTKDLGNLYDLFNEGIFV